VTGFSPDWLDLREGADHRARNPDLLAALSARLGDRRSLSVVDLGCGTGSNLRAVAPVLPAVQHWRLVDHDPALLLAARERIADWADDARVSDDALVAKKSGRQITVTFAQADLARDLDAALGTAPDLVTAAALFDLVSAGWIQRLAAATAERGASFYTALTYNGEESWFPPHPADAAVLAAFHAHQGGDKGFGLSAGPTASRCLAEAFTGYGYTVRDGESSWRLDRSDAALIGELAQGIARAVRETGRVPDPVSDAWREDRIAHGTCVVGHTDLFAIPP
jgi:SAM-dependent methyltransferase